ncbi:MAG: hypothetical protein ACJAS3_002542 [Roseivirga sp.]|jgi:hypothetical protein
MQQPSAELVVQQQLEAYNNRNINTFMATMSTEIVLYNFADGKLLAQGFKDVKAMYSSLFSQSPQLHSELTNRIVLGNQVIDHETITGRMGSSEAIELVVIYEVSESKIYKITVLRK